MIAFEHTHTIKHLQTYQFTTCNTTNIKNSMKTNQILVDRCLLAVSAISKTPMRITRDADSEWIAEFDLQYLVYLPNQYFE